MTALHVFIGWILGSIVPAFARLFKLNPLVRKERSLAQKRGRTKRLKIYYCRLEYFDAEKFKDLCLQNALPLARLGGLNDYIVDLREAAAKDILAEHRRHTLDEICSLMEEIALDAAELKTLRNKIFKDTPYERILFRG